MSFLSPSKDILIVLVIVLLFVGPKQLPKLARSLGESHRALRDAHDELKPAVETPADDPAV